MITRSHVDDRARSTALYSDCETYRYTLTRTWGDGPKLLYVMLNPSKATETANDPTIERCERRARALGYGAFCATNIFGLRETDPHKMRKHTAPDGPDNDAALRDGAAWADDILAAWGVHGAHRGRGPQVAQLLRDTGTPLYHLGLTKDGHPRHPLYVAYAQPLIRWSDD
ncbi:DUF1643 domain-containing protein [Yoonia sp. R2331]|uniref:DUF1643 domain-containing protein n=1 Tax=Yoonia sp. R2331 TaxID=3237238 RepID=UPI0034E4854F